jgi:phage shock protein C
MYCTSCGLELPEDHRFCHQCGTATGKGSPFSASVKPSRFLSRPREGRKIAGVCAGIARYLDVDVTLIRIMMICLLIAPPSLGLILYIVSWIVMPKDRRLLTGPTLSAPNVIAVRS